MIQTAHRIDGNCFDQVLDGSFSEVAIGPGDQDHALLGLVWLDRDAFQYVREYRVGLQPLGLVVQMGGGHQFVDPGLPEEVG